MGTPFLDKGSNPIQGIELQSLGVLKGLSDPGSVSKTDIAGMIAGGLIGWWFAGKFPKVIVKYIGVIVGAELGILIARMISGKTTVGGKGNG